MSNEGFCRGLPGVLANIDAVGIIETLIEGLAKYSWRTFFGIFVASSALLLFPVKLGIQIWVNSNRVYLVIAALVSGAILLTHLVTVVNEHFVGHKKGLDLRMVIGDPLHSNWSISQSPGNKKPMMIVLCSMSFAHNENISIILKRGYLQGTREVFAMNPIIVEGSHDEQESICISVQPVKAKPGKDLKARLVFVDQFNNKYKSEKITFKPNTVPDDFIKNKILTASAKCAFCGQPVTFESQAKEAQGTAHSSCIWP